MPLSCVARRGWLELWRAENGTVRDFALILGAGLLLLAAGIGLRDPWPPDEPRFALMARDMVDSGRWLFPMRAGELYADKPPLFIWLIAAGYLFTGSLRVAFLLPGLLAGLATLLLVHDLGHRLWDRRGGLAAALVLLTTFQFTLFARSGQIDPLLTFWTTLSLYGLLRHLLLGPQWRWHCCGWAAAGFGIITKGVGFLPLLVLLPYGYAAWRAWPGLTRSGGWKWAAGPLCLLLATSIWLVPMLLAVHEHADSAFTTYRNEILLGQTVDRYIGPRGHIKPPWYFLIEVIPLFWLPLSALFPWLAPRWAADLKRRETIQLLLLCWVVLVLLFFTLSPAKRGVYLLPALPAVALAAAPHLSGLLQRPAVKQLALMLSVSVTVLLGLVLLYFKVLDPGAGARIEADHGIQPWIPLAGMLLAFTIIVAATRVHRAVAGSALMIVAFWSLAGWWLFPALNPAISGSHFMSEVRSMLDPQHELGVVRFKEKFLVHVGQPVTHFGYRRPDVEQEFADAAAWLARSPRRRLLVGEDGWQSCFATSGAQFVARTSRRDWYLVEKADIRPDCAGAGDASRAVEFVPAGTRPASAAVGPERRLISGSPAVQLPWQCQGNGCR